MRADHVGDVDRLDVLVAQRLGDRGGLLEPELGEPRAGHDGAQSAGHVVVGLSVADEEEAHSPQRRDTDLSRRTVDQG